MYRLQTIVGGLRNGVAGWPQSYKLVSANAFGNKEKWAWEEGSIGTHAGTAK